MNLLPHTSSCLLFFPPIIITLDNSLPLLIGLYDRVVDSNVGAVLDMGLDLEVKSMDNLVKTLCCRILECSII